LLKRKEKTLHKILSEEVRVRSCKEKTEKGSRKERENPRKAFKRKTLGTRKHSRVGLTLFNPGEKSGKKKKKIWKGGNKTIVVFREDSWGDREHYMKQIRVAAKRGY